jgi:hypothetical protein
MTASFAARLIVGAVASAQGVMPLFIDLNRTHATNPLWTGHARFHLVQQVSTGLLVAAIEVGLLGWPGRGFESRFYLAALLTATSLAGFLLAVLSRQLYGGTLRDPNGYRPVRMRVGVQTVELDLNVAIVFVAAVVLVGAVIAFWMSV